MELVVSGNENVTLWGGRGRSRAGVFFDYGWGGGVGWWGAGLEGEAEREGRPGVKRWA